MFYSGAEKGQDALPQHIGGVSAINNYRRFQDCYSRWADAGRHVAVIRRSVLGRTSAPVRPRGRAWCRQRSAMAFHPFTECLVHLRLITLTRAEPFQDVRVDAKRNALLRVRELRAPPAPFPTLMKLRRFFLERTHVLKVFGGQLSDLAVLIGERFFHRF